MELSGRGYHFYSEQWEVTVGERSWSVSETGGMQETPAISVIKDGSAIICHLPRQFFFSCACMLFMRRGVICCQVTSTRRCSSDLPLDIPCLLFFEGRVKILKSLSKD